MSRAQMTRLGAPVAFLLAVTVAVLLIRSALHTGVGAPSGARAPVGTAPAVTGAAATSNVFTLPGGTTDSTGSAARRYYTVQKGDTFGAIAARLGTTIAKLEALNPHVDPTTLQVGQKIRIK